MDGYIIESDQFKKLVSELGKIKENYEPKNEIFKILWAVKKVGDA